MMIKVVLEGEHQKKTLNFIRSLIHSSAVPAHFTCSSRLDGNIKLTDAKTNTFGLFSSRYLHDKIAGGGGGGGGEGGGKES